MNQGMTRAGYFSGIITPFWLAIGVFTAGDLYPDYSHINQAMSELGAIGAPTHTISPVINNYPLGILFILFGISVLGTFRSSLPSKISGVLIIAHGLASISAGYFPCDAGCTPNTPSTSQVIHNLSGMVMFLSLIIASGIWVFIAGSFRLQYLGWFSFLCTLIAITALPLMASALASGSGFGLFQRINYGVSVIWVAGFAYILLGRDTHHSNNQRFAKGNTITKRENH